MEYELWGEKGIMKYGVLDDHGLWDMRVWGDSGIMENEVRGY